MPKYDLNTFLDRLTERMEQLDVEINDMKKERAKQYANRYSDSAFTRSDASTNVALLDTRLRDLETSLNHLETRVEALLIFQTAL
jgi:hypothetical protein